MLEADKIRREHGGLEYRECVGDDLKVTEFLFSHKVSSKEEFKAVMDQARKAGATIVKPAHNTFWGGYAGYFQDPDQHLWEIAGILRGELENKEGGENDQQNLCQSPCKGPRQVDGILQSSRLLVQPTVYGQDCGLYGHER
jgi:hypothetical protein